MTEVAINERPYQLFVSYAHEDRDFVVSLVQWLTRIAGLAIWHDDRSLATGSAIATDLAQSVRLAAGAMFIISKAAVKSGWVKEEYGAALEQRARHSEYRILVLRVDDTEPPGFLRTTKWIDVRGDTLTPRVALGVLLGLYGGSAMAPRSDRDVYISRTWRVAEAEEADAVCRLLIDRGYRLIGDATDQKVFDATERIPSIIMSCGALVAIAPNRGGGTSPYIEDEIEIALKHEVPCMAVLQEGAALSENIRMRLSKDCRIPIADLGQPNGVQLFHDVLREQFRPPRRPHYMFYAASLLKAPDMNEQLQQLIEVVTGIRCVLGENLTSQHAQMDIIKSIRGALFMIADVSEDGVNTLIEAGVALGAGTRLHLVARGDPRPPRFMFRDIEIQFYADDLELIGRIHRLVRPYRRRVLNHDLQEEP